MPLRVLASVFGGTQRVELDDAAWLPAAQTHEAAEVSVPYDLAVQARLRRERERAGEGEHVVCLGPAPMGRVQRLFWCAVFLAAGWGFGAAAAWNLSHAFHVGWTIALLVGSVVGLIATHAFLGTFNPRLSLLCDRDTFAPGEPATVRWRFSRPPRRARNLKILLRCEERATYRQGTSDTTARETVFEEVRAELAGGPAGPPVEGSFGLGLPADAAHSFESDNNALAWSLHAKAERPWWPDVRRAASLRVWSGLEPTPGREERA